VNQQKTVLYIATRNPLYQEPDWFREAFQRDGIRFVRADERASEAENAALAPDADAMLVCAGRYPVTAQSFERLRNCGLVVRMGVGYEMVDVAEATRRGILVANMPASIAEDVSDHTIALMLACLRYLVPQTAAMRSGRWAPQISRPTVRLRGQVLGLVGCGDIARRVVQKSAGFGLTYIGYDPYLDPALAAKYGIELVSFDELLQRADIISIHAPATPETRQMFDAAAFSKMKTSAVLVNTARGALVDEGALVTALRTGQIRAAALDVFANEPIPSDSPLLALDNVVLTPHVAGYSTEGVLDYFRAGHRLIADFLLWGQAPKSMVNPEVLKQA